MSNTTELDDIKKQEDDKKKKEDEKRKQEYNKKIEICANIASNIMTRYRNLKDPVLRHMMLIDKIYLILDGILGAMETIDDVNPQVKQKVDKVISETKKDLSDLSEWIMSRNNPNEEESDSENIPQPNKSSKSSKLFSKKIVI
jgi:hypothetical protein